MRDSNLVTPGSLARMRHLKLKKNGWHHGEETPNEGWWSETKQKHTIVNEYDSDSSEGSYSSWGSDYKPTLMY